MSDQDNFPRVFDQGDVGNVSEKTPSGERRMTSSTGGQKGVKPARFDLLDSSFLWEVAEVCGFGSVKYDDENWRKGYPWKFSYGALQRHLHLFLQGEDYDQESGLHHLAHVGWHCMVLMVFSQDPQYAQFDTRQMPRGNAPEQSPVAGESLTSQVSFGVDFCISS